MEEGNSFGDLLADNSMLYSWSMVGEIEAEQTGNDVKKKSEKKLSI